MFNSIGGKIKVLAVVLCWVGIIVSVLAGIGILGFAYLEDELIIPGIIVFIGGTIISWISSFFMYGFGELIEKTCEIALFMRQNTVLHNNNDKVDNRESLIAWKEKGLITEEEFRAKMVQLEDKKYD